MHALSAALGLLFVMPQSHAPHVLLCLQSTPQHVSPRSPHRLHGDNCPCIHKAREEAVADGHSLCKRLAVKRFDCMPVASST
eukprot:1160443-Pelagomonas_calceolata.AAC.15